MKKVGKKINDALMNPAGSFWFKRALADALDRDPVDALSDAQQLLDLLKERNENIKTTEQRTMFASWTKPVFDGPERKCGCRS